MYLNIHIFPTTGYARVLIFMFIRRELGGTGTGCLFQFTYCGSVEWNCLGFGRGPYEKHLCALFLTLNAPSQQKSSAFLVC